MHVLCSRQDHLAQHDPKPPPGDGQDGVDCPLGGGVCSHSTLPHNAADCDGLLEVSSVYLTSFQAGHFTAHKQENYITSSAGTYRNSSS